ncbi:MAG: ABC transporter substrate-binding protein [Candidatus Promineofilum sp.]|nr:ABC transporter substrate-binding protein [Promineifilum sp.]
MKPLRILSLMLIAVLLAVLVACGGTTTTTEEAADNAAETVEEAANEAAETVNEAAETGAGLGMEAAAVATEFFSQEDLDNSIRLISVTPEGPEGEPWNQYLEPNFIDTTQYAKEGPYTFCFSNAGVNNPWRVVGYTTMQAEVDLHPEIEEFIHVDAEGNDEKQIADIQDLVASGNCDILIVSPNTTLALTPAVEEACKSLPVVVFDRGVQTDCPATFVQPIGGYAFGYTGAKFLADNLPDGAKVVALRILPGVDVLETRWAAAKQVFEQENIDVVEVQFGDGNNDKVKTIITDAIQKYGQIDGVWMDAGATAVAAIEAFEDAGQPYPVINGEDQQDFLVKWQENDLTAIAPTFPTFQWRTAIIAALKVLQGEQVPDPWRLPQPAVTQENLDQYVQPGMPPLHYAMCGCETMPDFPERWGGTASQ